MLNKKLCLILLFAAAPIIAMEHIKYRAPIPEARPLMLLSTQSTKVLQEAMAAFNIPLTSVTIEPSPTGIAFCDIEQRKIIFGDYDNPDQRTMAAYQSVALLSDEKNTLIPQLEKSFKTKILGKQMIIATIAACYKLIDKLLYDPIALYIASLAVLKYEQIKYWGAQQCLVSQELSLLTSHLAMKEIFIEYTPRISAQGKTMTIFLLNKEKDRILSQLFVRWDSNTVKKMYEKK